jgi:hypothetical protein
LGITKTRDKHDQQTFPTISFCTYIPITKSIYVSEVSVGQQPLCSLFKKTAQFVYEDFKTIHLRMKAWHDSLFCGSKIHTNPRGSTKLEL